MIAPSVLIANAGQQFNLSRCLIQAMPPAGDVFGLIKRSAHHVLANCLAIPVVLFGHVLRPMHQSSRLSGLNPVIERPVMALLETGVPMTFAGSLDPCAYVEVKSIGALRPPAMTAVFCELIKEHTGIPVNQVYIGF